VFEALLRKLDDQPKVTSHPRGVAFLRATKELYQLAAVGYACINLQVSRQKGRYSHCVYTDGTMSQWVGSQTIEIGDDLTMEGAEGGAGPCALIIPLRQHVTETAVLVTVRSDGDPKHDHELWRQLAALGGYFHEHVLRLNGHDTERKVLLSARELDCLKWTAEGKTAWEASVILGISERTVRFHLNAAREKLDCATTVQAVAKAVKHNVIEPRL
jgi:DNA-binding CsgD family transcriptional regulator